MGERPRQVRLNECFQFSAAYFLHCRQRRRTGRPRWPRPLSHRRLPLLSDRLRLGKRSGGRHNRSSRRRSFGRWGRSRGVRCGFARGRRSCSCGYSCSSRLLLLLLPSLSQHGPHGLRERSKASIDRHSDSTNAHGKNTQPATATEQTCWKCQSHPHDPGRDRHDVAAAVVATAAVAIGPL